MKWHLFHQPTKLASDVQPSGLTASLLLAGHTHSGVSLYLPPTAAAAVLSRLLPASSASSPLQEVGFLSQDQAEPKGAGCTYPELGNAGGLILHKQRGRVFSNPTFPLDSLIHMQ